MTAGDLQGSMKPPPAPSRMGPRLLELRYRSVAAFLIAYSVRLSRGEVFVETQRPLTTGLRTRLRLRAPEAPALEVEGRVAWTRPLPIGPGQPAGMGIVLTSSIEEHGAVIDGLAARYARIHILVASPAPATRTLIGRYLKSILSCDLVDGNLGRELGPSEPPIDLAVVDLDSEREVGELIIQTLKCRAETNDVPIIALAQLEGDRARAATLGADEVLTTPAPFAELHSTVIHVLSRPLVLAVG